MDIPLPRRKWTWRDSPWWRATQQSIVSCLLMMIMALPLLVFFVRQLTMLSSIHFDRSAILQELAEGGLLMFPYLWSYFFVLERISRQRPGESTPSPHHR
jgi:hypothetical protein